MESVLEASTAWLHKKSAGEMISCIQETLDYARSCGDYVQFRKWFYENRLRTVTCDSRETVPAALALCYLAGGDPEKSILYAVNFGRDADTIGTMAGSLAGALKGEAGIRKEWLEKLYTYNDQSDLAKGLYDVVSLRLEQEKEHVKQLEAMLV